MKSLTFAIQEAQRRCLHTAYCMHTTYCMHIVLVTVTAIDINDNFPVFSDRQSRTFHVREDERVNTTVDNRPIGYSTNSLYTKTPSKLSFPTILHFYSLVPYTFNKCGRKKKEVNCFLPLFPLQYGNEASMHRMRLALLTSEIVPPGQNYRSQCVIFALWLKHRRSLSHLHI